MNRPYRISAETTPEELHAFLEKEFPFDVDSWRFATDEIRDMSRWARQQLNLPESEAANFRVAGITPGEWNKLGTTSAVNFYRRMNSEQREQYTAFLREAFPEMFTE